MKSWSIIESEEIETPEEVINFLNEIDNICKKYNLSISHEDGHGAFIIEKYDSFNIRWLKDCLLNIKERKNDNI